MDRQIFYDTCRQPVRKVTELEIRKVDPAVVRAIFEAMTIAKETSTFRAFESRILRPTELSSQDLKRSIEGLNVTTSTLASLSWFHETIPAMLPATPAEV